MWASKTEGGDRAAFLCEHYCSECTAVKKNKISSLLRRQNQVINLSSRVWWLPWGWSFRQALKRASLCLLICRAHWWLKTVQGPFVAKQQITVEKSVVYSASQQPKHPFVLGQGWRKAAFHFPCSHRQHQLIIQALDFLLNELQSLISGSSETLNKCLVLILAKSLLYSV